MWGVADRADVSCRLSVSRRSSERRASPKTIAAESRWAQCAANAVALYATYSVWSTRLERCVRRSSPEFQAGLGAVLTVMPENFFSQKKFAVLATDKGFKYIGASSRGIDEAVTVTGVLVSSGVWGGAPAGCGAEPREENLSIFTLKSRKT